MSKNKIFLLALALVGLGLAGYFSYKGCGAYWRQSKREAELLAKKKAAWASLKKILGKQVADFKGEAGVIIEDLSQGWEISLNKDKLFPAASLVKIPIMAACFYAQAEGKISLKDKLVLKTSAKAPGSGVLKNMPAGSSITVDRLIELMIAQSDNTASNMLIDLLTPDYLNTFFKREGLKNTNLARKMMDFKHRKIGVENYTTAEDISRLLERIYRREFLNSAISDKCLAMLLRQKLRDRIPRKLPQDVPVAHKTGLERNVCHDAGIVFTPGGHFLVCVFTKSKNGSRQVKEFIANISLYIYNNYQQLPRL
jgi:beta-lactamase class A